MAPAGHGCCAIGPQASLENEGDRSVRGAFGCSFLSLATSFFRSAHSLRKACVEPAFVCILACRGRYRGRHEVRPKRAPCPRH